MRWQGAVRPGRKLGKQDGFPCCFQDGPPAGGPRGQGAEGLGAPCHQPQLPRPDPSTGSYVEGIVSLHYKTDKSVKEDLELQAWCREITEIGLLGGQD